MRYASALKTAIVLLLALAAHSGSAMTLYFSQDDDDGHAYVIANDAMLKESDAQKIRRFLDQQAARGVPTAIFLSSPGGFGELMASYAKAIVEPSNELLRRHNLYNILVVNDECSSACVILMSHVTNSRNPKALKMMIAPDSKFGFHSPVDMQNGSIVSIRDQAEREARIRIQIGLLAAGGVKEDWLKRNEALLRSARMTFVNGSQLCMDSSGILPQDSCVYGVADLGALAKSQLNSAVLLAQAQVRGQRQVRTASNAESIIIDRMSSRPAAAPGGRATVSKSKPTRKTKKR
jgi:hypothetical protein